MAKFVSHTTEHAHELALKIELDLDDAIVVEVGKMFSDKETGKLMVSITAKIRPEFEDLIDALNRINRLKKINY